MKGAKSITVQYNYNIIEKVVKHNGNLIRFYTVSSVFELLAINWAKYLDYCSVMINGLDIREPNYGFPKNGIPIFLAGTREHP